MAQITTLKDRKSNKTAYPVTVDEAVFDSQGQSLKDRMAQLATTIEGKAAKATTLAGYGIADAKIANGVITLGAATITPLVAADFVAFTDAEIEAILAEAGVTVATAE